MDKYLTTFFALAPLWAYSLRNDLDFLDGAVVFVVLWVCLYLKSNGWKLTDVVRLKEILKKGT